jgi:hypothetical protein
MLQMLITRYSKPLGAMRFGADRAVSLAQLGPNVQNCFSPLSYVFNPSSFISCALSSKQGGNNLHYEYDFNSSLR